MIYNLEALDNQSAPLCPSLTNQTTTVEIRPLINPHKTAKEHQSEFVNYSHVSPTSQGDVT